MEKEKVKSEVQIQLEDNFKAIDQLIKDQKFTIGDALLLKDYYYNIIRKMEDLENSRDHWKSKYQELKEKKYV